MLRMMNYYYHVHVVPLKSVRRGSGCSISPDAVFSNPERIVMGNSVRIGSRCHIWAGHATGTIEIGDDCLFGPEVMVTAATYRFNEGHPVTRQKMDEDDVVIGCDVWLGTRAVVLPGSRIGDGAIIGAGALVKGEIPAMAIAVGQPARVVGMRETPSASPLSK
jgi:acetyltransferase-like isoleucine patch superfamily enzyme